jgi:hypothetical protein
MNAILRHMRLLPLLALGLLGLLAAGAAIPAVAADEESNLRASEPFHWSGPLAAGKVLEVKGVNGTIRAELAAGQQAEVTATKHARRSDPDEVRIEVIKHDEGITFCAVYPGGDNGCEAGESWHSHTRNNDVQVDFVVKVPAGVRFSGQTVNGAVDAADLRGPVVARTVNGSVAVSTSAEARATTVNGSITARLGRMGSEDLEFETVNGSITLYLPRKADAEVRAQTVNGGISTDFPLTVQGQFGPKHVTGTIGSGGRTITLKTVNGAIRLRMEGGSREPRES